MPSLALVALALVSTSLISAAPVPQAGSWWHPSAASHWQPSAGSHWQPSDGSWSPWPAPSGAPEGPSFAPAGQSSAPAIASSPPTAPTPAPAAPSSQPAFASSAPAFPSSPPTIPTSVPTVPSSVPTAGSSPPANASPSAAPSPSSSAPSTPSPSSSGSGSGSGSIDTSYYPTPGDGSSSAFHSFFDSKIVAFEDLWNAWHSALLTNNNNDATAVQWIHDAIASQSASSGISGSLILSVIMQESSGIIGTGATGDASGGSDGGMMQCEGCPSVATLAAATSDTVSAMISGGVAHFQQNMAAAGGDDWTSLRLYNSGSLQGTDLSNPSYGPASTPAYVENIANRMHGWIH